MLRVSLGRVKKFQSVDFSANEMKQIGTEAMTRIRKRVAQGIGVNGRPMRPLSRSYAARKSQKGQPAIRNLMFSGAMLGWHDRREART